MKIARAIIIAAVPLIVCVLISPLVGFHYPRVIENEPLKDPHKVARFEGTNLFLEDGAVIALLPFGTETIADQIRMANFEIDLEREADGSCCVLARQKGWICGTPWSQPILIPLIADTVYKNRREVIGVGSYVAPKDAKVVK